MGRARHPVLAIVILACVASPGCSKPGPLSERVVIGGEPFDLEVARDDAARILGLKHRTEIPADGGMLFIFADSQVRSFWMADCLVPMDLIFLDPQGRVTATHRMSVEPPRREDETLDAYERRIARYGSVYPAQFAIELRAGSVERLGIRFDERIELDLRRLKALAR